MQNLRKFSKQQAFNYERKTDVLLIAEKTQTVSRV